MRSFLLLLSIISLSFAQNYQTISFVDLQTGVRLAATLVATNDPNAPYNVELLPLAVNDNNQQWLVTDAEGFITNKAQPGYAFDVNGYSSTPGTAVDVWTKKTAGDTSANQQWTLNPDGSISSFLGNNLYLTPVFDPNGANTGTLTINTQPKLATIGYPPVTPQVCSSISDPHLTPFAPSPNSGQLLTPGIQIPGDFKLAILGDTNVYSEINHCGPAWPTAYCNFNASVQNGGYTVVVTGDSVTGNNLPVTIGTTAQLFGQISVTRLGPGRYTINFPEGYLNIIPNPVGYGIQDLLVTVTAAPAPYGGLCGSYQGSGSRKRAVFTSLADFIQSWKVLFQDDPFDYASYEQWLLNNPTAFNSTLGNLTTTDQNLLNLVNTVCGPLQSSPLVQQCTGILDASQFYQACHDDVILTGSAGFAAPILNAFAYKCAVTAPPGTTITLPTSALNTIASGPGLADNVDQGGVSIGFTIQARNALDESVGTGGDTWTITSNGPANLVFTVTDLQNGNYDVTYVPSTVGSYIITIEQGINQIFGSPFPIKINPVVTDPTQSTASGAGLGPSIPSGSLETFIVTARTSSGAQRTSSSDSVTVTYTGFALSTSVTNNGDGTFTVKYAQELVGSFTITVKINNINIKGSPFTVTAN